jgi:uncharacterized membrane protein HdeD (DUF308 family)
MTAIAQPMAIEKTMPALGWGWLLILGIVQIIAGGTAVVIPVVASFAAVAIFGAVLIVTAIFQMIHAFKAKPWTRTLAYGLGSVLYAICGLFVLLYPIGGALTLAVIIAILLITEGALRLGFVAFARPPSGGGWLAVAGLGGIFVGVVLLIGWPATALWVTGLLLGINLIFTGAMHVALALASRAILPAAAG